MIEPTRIVFMVPEETDTVLRVTAAKRRITKSELLREIVADWLTAQGLIDLPVVDAHVEPTPSH